MKKANTGKIFFCSCVAAFLVLSILFLLQVKDADAQSYGIVLSEVLANAQDEMTGEFVELYNTGQAPVDIAGWFLKDNSSDVNDTLKDFTGEFDVGIAGTVIPAGGMALVVDPQYAGQYNEYILGHASISAFLMLTIDGDVTLGNGLSNGADSVIIDDGAGYVATYSWVSDAGEGISFQKINIGGGDGASNWTSATSDQNKITPGILFSNAQQNVSAEEEHQDGQQQNEMSPPASASSQNNVPRAVAGADMYVNVGATVRFDASQSTDADGNNLSFVWNFGDGSTAKGTAVTHTYYYQGVYFVGLIASDGMAQGVDQLTVYVYPAGVFISEFLPNPEGNDDGKEWIELHNTSERVVDIGGWQIADKSGKTFVLPVPTFIVQNGYLVLDGKNTGITLNNADEEIFLRYPNGEVADRVAFSDAAKEGYSAAKFGDQFLWTQARTPGFDNVKLLSEQEREKVSALRSYESDKKQVTSNKNSVSKLTSGKFGVAKSDSVVVSLLVNVAEAKTVSGYLEEVVGGEGGALLPAKAGERKEYLAANISAARQMARNAYFWLFSLVAFFGFALLAKKLAKK